MISKRNSPNDRHTMLPCFYFVELPIVASSMLSLYLLEVTEVLRPPLVAWRCNDPALSLPYIQSGDELVPLVMLLSLAFSGPAAAIMLVEAVLYILRSEFSRRSGAESSLNNGGCRFNSFLRRTVCFVGVHVFGLVMTALITDMLQVSTGYQAPFFLTVCRPNYSSVSCSHDPYVTRDICSGPDHYAIHSARKTFPSQHASLSAFAAVYVSMYFNATISDRTRLLKAVLVLVFMMAAGLAGLTQVTQHRNHAQDVYVGFLVGGFIAAYLVLHGVANFQSSEDVLPGPPPAPHPDDALRALTERGHDSVYNKGPASASDSNDEISGPVGGAAREDQAGQEEALPPMVTFSNSLPRASINLHSMLGTSEEAEGSGAGPEDRRRLKEVLGHMQHLHLEGGRGEEEEGDHPVAGRKPPGMASSTGGGPKAVVTPRPPQTAPPPVSPKSALTRARWLAIAERGGAIADKGGAIADRGGASQPRLLQVIAMSRQQGLLPSPAQPGSGVTVDAHGPHHPVVHASPPPPPQAQPPPVSGSPWELRGVANGSSFRPDRGASDAELPPSADGQAEGGRDWNRRKTALVLLEQDLYNKLQGRRIP